MLLGLGGNQGGGGGGGKGGNLMYLNDNFSFSRQKRIINAFVHSNFPIRAFWERRER